MRITIFSGPVAGGTSACERLLQSEGTELLRRMFQGHVDARGAGETTAPVVGSDGVERTHARISERDLTTVFGTVRLARMGYGRRDNRNGALHRREPTPWGLALGKQ